jgi:hypothetical protein
MKSIAWTLLIFILIVLCLCFSLALADTYLITLPENVKINECKYDDVFNGRVFGTSVQCNGFLNDQPYYLFENIYPTKAPVKIEYTDGLIFDIAEKK